MSCPKIIAGLNKKQKESKLMRQAGKFYDKVQNLDADVKEYDYELKQDVKIAKKEKRRGADREENTVKNMLHKIPNLYIEHLKETVKKNRNKIRNKVSAQEQRLGERIDRAIDLRKRNEFRQSQIDLCNIINVMDRNQLKQLQEQCNIEYKMGRSLFNVSEEMFPEIKGIDCPFLEMLAQIEAE